MLADDSQTSFTSGSNSSRALKGTMRTFVGATRGGNDRTYEGQD